MRNEKDIRVVVLGAKGMLGSDLVDKLTQCGFKVVALDLPEFNITDNCQLTAALADADLVVNCAAYTNVDKAESEEELAYKVNAEAVENLGVFAAANGIRVIHISTDFVFDGMLDRPYTEDDPTSPVNVYGQSKLEGEKRLINTGARSCIIRVQWTYGHHGTNFIKKLLEFAKTRDSLKVVDDQTGAPTATTEAALAICRIAGMEDDFPQGIYHFAAAGFATRYQTAQFIITNSGLDTEVTPCSSSEFPSPAKRPNNSRFDCSKIERVLGCQIKPWQGPLEMFLKELPCR